MEDSALVWRRAPWCGGARPGVEESSLVSRREFWCRGGRPRVEEGAMVWRRAPWFGGGRPGVEESALVWGRAPWCGGERPGVEVEESAGCPGVEESAGHPGVEEGALVWMRMPLARGGRVAHLVRRRAPLRRESNESTSDIRRKRTHLVLMGRLMPRRREGRPPLPVSAPVPDTHYLTTAGWPEN